MLSLKEIKKGITNMIPVAPVYLEDDDGIDDELRRRIIREWYVCPKCGRTVFHHYKFCNGCGKKLFWG